MSKIICKNLHFNYENENILHNISFNVEEGSFCVVLGKNGSGKTTLLKCLKGLLNFQKGQIFVNGLDIQKSAINEIAKNISMLLQSEPHSFHFKVIDIVVMGRNPFLKMNETPKEKDYSLAYNSLISLKIENLADKNFNKISGGERQLVMLATALTQNANIVLLDEPTNHLDFNNQYYVLNFMKNLCRKKNTTVITSMHNPNLAMMFADEIIMLDNKKIMANGKTKDVMTEKNISRLYKTEIKKVRDFDDITFFIPKKNDKKNYN